MTFEINWGAALLSAVVTIGIAQCVSDFVEGFRKSYNEARDDDATPDA